jgi:hypothetical protein
MEEEDVVVASSDLFGEEDVDDSLEVFAMTAPACDVRYKLPYVSGPLFFGSRRVP